MQKQQQKRCSKIYDATNLNKLMFNS